MSSRRATCLILLLLACACTTGTPVPTQEPRPEDVATLDGIMTAFYAVVNLAPDAPRQWGRDRTLYSPWIRFVATSDERRHPLEVWTHQQLVDETEPLIRAGFRERELHRRTTRYGRIAHIDSTYETVSGLASPKTSRGVNGLDLYFDGQRWWIASVMWQGEDGENPIPPELLP